MKRRGGSASQAAPSSNIASADVDDRKLSAEAAERAARKAAAEAGGQRPLAAGQSLPLSFFLAAAAVLGIMVYLTLKYS